MKASRSTARVMPMPRILSWVTDPVAKEVKTTAMRMAEAERTPPVCWSPMATESMGSPVRSYSSRMRESRKTS